MFVSSRSLGFAVGSENSWIRSPEAKATEPASLFAKTSLLIKTVKDTRWTGYVWTTCLIPWKAWNSVGEFSIALTSHSPSPVCNQFEIVNWTKGFFITVSQG